MLIIIPSPRNTLSGKCSSGGSFWWQNIVTRGERSDSLSLSPDSSGVTLVVLFNLQCLSFCICKIRTIIILTLSYSED